jgi:endonuclease-3
MNNWAEKLQPLFEKYGGRKHPLNYENPYQFLVMIILAAQTTDNLINKIAPEFFRIYPSISDLKNSSPEDLHPLLKSVLGFRKKAVWLVEMAKQIGDDSHIPSTISDLTKLPGVGRKTANALIREIGGKAEGIMVDLHVVRVAPRLGIVTGENPDKIEKQLMEALPREMWNDTGMVFSFHGREICRPKPKCEECIVNSVCNYYQNIIAGNK